MQFYNRISAVNYAKAYALSYAPFWLSDKSTNGGGGDCTNFISQALFAGGWEMIEGFRWDPNVWYAEMLNFDRDDRSWTWAGAEPFSRFLGRSGRAHRCDFDALIPGDIVQEWRYGQIIHTMLVTEMTIRPGKKSIFLTYHSNDTLNRPFDDILKTYAGDKNVEFRFWKLHEFYNSYKDTTKWLDMTGPVI
jgi:hypothetical protein